MDLGSRLTELQQRTHQHRELLLTEEAAKTALVMPFIQALGYDVFNPSEVVPEFTADVGIKKGEKVDYAICHNGKLSILVECKISSAELSVNHASQLFRYFSATECRIAILTNGVVYQFYADIERQNIMDEKPFFTFTMESVKPTDIATLEGFCKTSFDVSKILREAGNLKLQTLLRKELEKEFSNPSEEFIRALAGRVYEGRITSAVKENMGKLIVASIGSYIRDLVTERLSSALKASAPASEDSPSEPVGGDIGIVTTDEEKSGFYIIQAIASKIVEPNRIVMRDSKSYCAILLDDNNRRTVARLHFNGITTKYLGTFAGKDEERHLIANVTDIYKFDRQITKRLRELDEEVPAA